MRQQVLFHSKASQAMLLWLVTQSSPMKDCVTSWKDICLLSCHTYHATMCGYPGWPIMVLLWMPSLWKNFFFFFFTFLFCFKTAALRHHLFSWLEPWCEFHKLSYNPYCIVACLVGKRWWIHTVSALHNSLQANCQLAPDLCIVLSTNYHCLKN